jgi:hypothetical protein
MFNFLNKPYSFNDDLRHNAKIILFISLFILAFLLVFQPIEISELSRIEIFYLVTGMAASTFLVLSINLIIIPSIFPRRFYVDVWDIKREIIWNIWLLITISFSNILFYAKLFGVIDTNFSIIWKIIAIGSLPVAILIIINQHRLLRSNLKSARQLNNKLIEGKLKFEKLVHFESEYKKDSLTIKPQAIILIKSADNYIEIYYQSENIIKKQMIRSSLKKAIETVNHLDFIVRCHRTFVVNTNHIKEIQGNSQGYKLYFQNIDFPALVSQKYISEFRKII